MLRWKGREKDLIPFLMTQLTLHVHEAILSYSKTFLLSFPRIEENEEKTIYIYIYFFFLGVTIMARQCMHCLIIQLFNMTEYVICEIFSKSFYILKCQA